MVVECQISSDDCEIIGDCDKQGIECDGVTAFLLTAEGHFRYLRWSLSINKIRGS